MTMNVLLAVFVCLIAYACIHRVIASGEIINSTFLTKENTSTLRGIAIIAISFAHICQSEPNLANSLLGGKHGYTIVFSWGSIGVAVFFLLSGYGCFLSINKTRNNFTWVMRHTLKMLLYFVVAYAFCVAVRIGALGETIATKELVESFFTLRLPGTSSWYFKIQILFYILLAVSNQIKKNQCYIVSALVLVYALLASFEGLADYWWKTSLCFAAGCLIAMYREKASQFASKIWINILLVLIGGLAFVYTRRDFHYYLIPQLIAYICISMCIVVVWNSLGGKNKLLDKVGKASLAVYLVHIGVVDTVYALPSNFIVKTLIFIVAVLAGSALVYFLAEKVNKYLMSNAKNNY